jgi:hypothetical protein
MGQISGVVSTTAKTCVTLDKNSAFVQTDVIGVDLQQMERQTIAFLYELWRLQGVTNKKIVTVKR